MELLRCGGELLRNVKRMAREFSEPTVMLAQFNRDSERDARKPRLADPRDPVRSRRARF
jgi:hypothetical protein